MSSKAQGWKGLMGRVAALGLLAGCMGWLVGCSSAEEDRCVNRFECATGQVCLSGTCSEPAPDGSCASDDECVLGDVCFNRLCVADNDDPNNDTPNNDVNNDVNNDQPNNDVNNDVPPDLCGNGICNAGEDEDSCPADCEEDVEPPQVVSVTPEAGSVGVSVDSLVAVTFSEPVRDFGLAQKITISNADTLEAIEAVASLNGSVVTLQPAEPLQAGTPYLVLVTNQISDAAGNRLPDDFRWYFSTAVSPEPEYAQIARQFAPVVHQEVEDDPTRGRGDYFTLINYDGNFNAGDNLVSLRESNRALKAYYNVLETETHVLVQYLFYYPAYYNNISDESHEHDLTATLVVLAKNGEELEFVMAEGAYRDQYLGFAVEGSGIEDRNQGRLVLTFPAEELLEGRHYPAYHARNFHGSCHWLWEPGGFDVAQTPWCSHSAGEFRDDTDSVVLYPDPEGVGATVGQIACMTSNPDACNPDAGITCQTNACRDADGFKAQTYGLEDFREQLWVRRVNISGDDQLFNGRATYRPFASPEPRPGAGENRRFPAALVSQDTDSRGEMPFIWDAPGAIEPGQWWVDPAYTLTQAFRFPGEGTFSNVYCYNPYFDIDRRGEEGCQ